MSAVSSLRSSASSMCREVFQRNNDFGNIIYERKEEFIPLPCSSKVSESDTFKKNQRPKEEKLSTSLNSSKISEKIIQKRGEMSTSSGCLNMPFSSNIIKKVKMHTGKKPFNCSNCSYKSSFKCDLIAHKRTHTGEKPFSCSNCSYKSSNKSHLTRHMRTHNELT